MRAQWIDGELWIPVESDQYLLSSSVVQTRVLAFESSGMSHAVMFLNLTRYVRDLHVEMSAARDCESASTNAAHVRGC